VASYQLPPTGGTLPLAMLGRKAPGSPEKFAWSSAAGRGEVATMLPGRGEAFEDRLCAIL